MQRWRLWTMAPVAAAYAGFVLVGVSSGVGGVLLPAQIADYDVDRATIGITFFTFSAGFMLSGALVGPLMHRLGTRLALLAGAACFVLAAGVTALRPPLMMLFAVQVVAGFGSGLLESVLNTYLSELPEATTLLNRLHAFFGIGALAGPVLAAWLLGFTAWTTVWLVLGVACLPLAAAFAVTFPRRTVPEAAPANATGTGTGTTTVAAGATGAAGTAETGGTAEATSATGAEAGVTGAGVAGAGVAGAGVAGAGGSPGRGLLAEALRSPAIMLASVFLAVYVGLEMSVGNWGYSFLVDERGQRELLAGYSVSGYWLGLTLGRFLISPFASRVGVSDTTMSAWCLAGVTASTLLLWISPAAVLASAAMLLLGFFLGPLFPTAMAVVPRLTSARMVATAIGVMNGVSVIGGSLLPWLAGTISQTAGLWTLPPYVLLMAAVQLVVWRSVARHTAPAPTPVPAK